MSPGRYTAGQNALSKQHIPAREAKFIDTLVPDTASRLFWPQGLLLALERPPHGVEQLLFGASLRRQSAAPALMASRR